MPFLQALLILSQLSVFSSHLSNFHLSKTKHKHEILAASVAEIAKFYYLANQTQLTIIRSVKRTENKHKLIDILDVLIKSLNVDNQHFITAFQIEEPSSIVYGKAPRRSSNLLFIDSVESFKDILKVFNSINFRIRKIFTIISIVELTVEEMKTIFELFLKIFIINSNIVTFNSTGTINLFTFFPFRSSSDCHNTNPVKISTFIESTSNWSSKNLHNRKADNLFGCSLRIGSAVKSAEPALMYRVKADYDLDIYGVEKEIFDELSHRLNFTAVYIPFFNGIGTVFPNGTGFGVLGEVLGKNVDVGIGFVSLQYVRTLFLSETTFYTMTALILIGKS